MRRIVAIAAMAAAGCATAAATPEEEVAPVHGEGACDAARAQTLVGRPASAALGAEALRLTGATSLRWIQPDDMVTMDYRTDRLNIALDERNRVKTVRCG